jgi:diguanylate cyclase (GGDEF)-like protein/PAS domain S-box-containing protein
VTGTQLDGIDPRLLNDALPLGVLVTDTVGVVRHANARAAAMTGYSVEEAVGHSILDYVIDEDIDFLVASLAHGTDYPGMVMGPARLRYRHRDGSVHWTEYWAFECPESFGFSGYIVTMTTESVTDNLSNAVHGIATGQPIETSLASVARAVNAYPLVATGTILVPRGAVLDVIGSWPLTDHGIADDPTTPWHDVFETAASIDLAVDELPEATRQMAAAAGFRSVWIRPVVTQSGKVAAVFVAWRYEPGFASPNQERHLAETIGVARVAFDHEEHRAQLQRAALTDHLTGLGNRALLARRLGELEAAPTAVLYIDLDGFKLVNDTHGHDAGDAVLAAAAQRIVTIVRAEDAVFRMGGDEFVVICVDLESDPVERDATISTIAQRIVDSLSTPFHVDGLSLRIGASVGAAMRQPGDSPDHVIRRADRALLAAKRAGKSCWRRHDGDHVTE